MFIKESLNKKYYFVSLAGAIILYFAAIKVVQDFLYRGFTRPENLFKSLGPLFSRPEPLEMPLYLLGIVAIPLLAAALLPFTDKVISLMRQMWQRGRWKYLVILAGIVFLIAGYVLVRAVNFDFYLNYIQDKGLGKAIWLLLTKRIFVARLIFFIGAAVLVWAYFLSPPATPLLYPPAGRAGKGGKERGIRGGWEGIFLIFLAFLIFHPNLPIQDHHYVYFIGPVNDHLNGKPLLYETSHLYGLLNVYFLALIFKFVLPFSYASLSLILFIFYLAFFASLYYFLKKWLRSPLLAMIGVMVLVSVMYFYNTSPTRSVYFFPATSPFRFWLYLPILFLIFSYQKQPHRVKKELILFLAALAVFWNFESGLFIAAAAVLAFWYWEKFRFSKLVLLGLRFLGYLTAIFATITFINLAVYGLWPNWALFFKELHQFRQGIGMTPLPAVGVFQIYLLVYLGTGAWLLRRQLAGQEGPNLVLMFLVLHGIFSLLYYVGESSWQNLTIVSFPMFLIGIYLFQNFSQKRIAWAAALAVLVYAGLFLLVKLPVEFQNRDYTGLKSLAPVSDCTDQDVCADAMEIKEQYPELARVPLLHLADTRILPYINKPNFFDFYYLFTLYYHEDVQREVERLKRERPKFLFVGHQTDDRIDYFMSLLPQDFQKTGELRTLDIYEPR